MISEEIFALFIGLVAVIGIFILPVVTIAYVIIKLSSSNNKVNLELARHGIIPPVKAKPAPNKYRSLRNGILCIGTAIGVVIGVALSKYVEINPPQLTDSSIYIGLDNAFMTVCASTIFFIGLSYLVFYFIVRNKNLSSEE